ncbi:hypothetical protein LCGC14_0164260 [marine sediment metagenome]|uniref:ParB-like N-terminal domain-containing protein n=1 Tax=marine sediment metagenome TaxID=412755 RepID=A0A0F9VAL5_9ZZZZ
MDATRLVMRQVLAEQASVEAPTQPRHVWNMTYDHLREFFLDAVNREEDRDYDWQRYERIVTELFPEYTLATFDEGEHRTIWSAVYDALNWNPGEMAALVQNEPQILLDFHARIIGVISDEFGWSAGEYARSVFRSVQNGQESRYREIPLQVLRKLDNEMPLSMEDWPGVEDAEDEADPFEKAKGRFGITSSFTDAFYLLPDGDMISGGGGGYGRGFDHRNIGYGGGGTRGMQEFMSLGAIRLMPEDGGLDMMVQPTSAQYRTLEGWIDNFSAEGMPVDMEDGLGEFDERNDYYWKAERNKSYMFDPGENSRRIMGAIRRFYAGQDEALTESRRVIRRILAEAQEDELYPRAGDEVSGLRVGDEVPNTSSIAASLLDYEVLSGIRAVPLSAFETSGDDNEAARELAQQIAASGWIVPLIVVVDKEGPYVLEGSHRYDALHVLGVEALPALVVMDKESLPESVVASDVTLHKIDDEGTSVFYFDLGHGNTSYDDGMEYTDPLTHEIWVLMHGEIQRYHQLNMPNIEDEGVDLSDPEALQAYVDQQEEKGRGLPTWSHGMLWPNPDQYWKGHYEGDTGRLSAMNPGRFKLTNQLIGMLRSEFSPTEIHVFE